MGNNCYCGSNLKFENCCQPIIQQLQPAHSAEQLMRSRFSAFYLKDDAWLNQSWDHSTRPKKMAFDADLKWLDLTIIQTNDIDHLNSNVEFEARYLKAGKVDAIHENSHFIKREKQWLYVDGDYLKTTFKAFKVGRNDACPCASQLKFKSCCALS